jgi:hypothetical protein
MNAGVYAPRNNIAIDDSSTLWLLYNQDALHTNYSNIIFIGGKQGSSKQQLQIEDKFSVT